MLFIAGVMVFVLCLAGDFIAKLPGHPDWFDLIGLDDLAWRLMIFGALGILGRRRHHGMELNPARRPAAASPMASKSMEKIGLNSREDAALNSARSIR